MLLLALLLLQPAQPAEAPPDPRCPVIWNSDFVRAAGDVCFGQAGTNLFFAFAYPAQAARIPALDSLLRAEKDLALAGFAELQAYAREHPEMRLFEQYLYAVDADRPELLALSYRTANYLGGAHGNYGGGALIWDRAANRRIRFDDLFADGEAASIEVTRLLCPSFNAVRRRAFERGGGRVTDNCPEPPHDFALLAPRGDRIEKLRLFFAQLDGYAGRAYTVELPVTPRLISAMQPRFRAAFAVSSEAPLTCNSNVRDERCRR